MLSRIFLKDTLLLTKGQNRFSLQHPPQRGRSLRGRKRFSLRRTRLPLSSIKGPVSRSKRMALDRSTKVRPVAPGLLTTTALCPRSRLLSLRSKRALQVLRMLGPGRRTSRAMVPRWRTALLVHPGVLAVSSRDTASSRGCWAPWCNSPLISRRTRATRCARWYSRFW